jgi:hypothetical protein
MIRYGFIKNVEKLNGRLAMIGFTIIMIIEFLTKESFLTFFG